MHAHRTESGKRLNHNQIFTSRESSRIGCLLSEWRVAYRHVSRRVVTRLPVDDTIRCLVETFAARPIAATCSLSYRAFVAWRNIGCAVVAVVHYKMARRAHQLHRQECRLDIKYSGGRVCLYGHVSDLFRCILPKYIHTNRDVNSNVT